ncbi:MAG: MBG domain-containing protein [Limisphaerales bacterium]
MQETRFPGGSKRVAGSIILALVAAAPFHSASAQSQSATVSWVRSTSTDVVSYKVYYGGATRSYTNTVPAGSLTNATVSGLLPGGHYFFAATAVDSVGLESPYSNESTYQVPVVSTGSVPPITWSTPANIVYGTALGAAQLNATSSVGGAFTYTPPGGTVLNAGSQVLSVTFNPADTSSYVPVTTNVTLVVLPGALTITAANASKLYGAALPALAASYSGFVNGDTASSLTKPPTLTTTATAASPVGSYSITASGAASSNYTISYAGGTLTVNKAALTITGTNASKVYGAALPALTASYSGFVNGDTASSLTTPPALATTATAASPAGSYSITASGAASSNYTISYASGTLSVNPAALTITAANASKVYGAALPALTASYTGFVNGDTASSLTTPPALTTTATAASPVGSYSISASGAASSNYTISYASGTLTVNPAALTITAANANKVYGAALPALTASYSGLVNGDTASSLTTPPALTTTATSASPVGNYSISASGAASSNYTISYAAGTLTVNKAALTITAANASKVYGAALPALTASYSGLVNGDTASSLTTPPALTTTATAASPVGSYSITAGGAASPNYTFVYVPGTLAVTQASTTGVLSSSGNPSPPGQAVTFSVSLSAAAPGAGTPTGTVQFEIDGAAAGAPVSLSGGTASYITATLAQGSHTVAAEYAGDANFLGVTSLLASEEVITSSLVAGSVTIYRGATNGVKVSIANLLTNASDSDGNPITFVGASATSANGGTVTTNSGWVFYMPATGFTNTDTFTYLVTDGEGAPVAGTVTVAIMVDDGASANLTITSLGNGSVAIGGQGIPGRTYLIQYTTDTLPTTNWLALGTVTADASGAFVLIDNSVSGLQFYRTVCP